MIIHEEIFSLDFFCEGEKIFVRSSTGSNFEQHTLKHVEETNATLPVAKKQADSISEILGHAGKYGRLSRNDLSRLKEKCQVLHDTLLPPRTRTSLQQSSCSTIILGLDDRLVGIPWELLFDGNAFFSLRYNMGRVVSTRQTFSVTQRQIAVPMKMLLLTDPQGTLPSSYTEGRKLRDILDTKAELIRASLKSSSISTDYVKEKLRFFDILHYAGHTDYDTNHPGLSGFLLADGKLNAKTIKKMAGQGAFPAFVFLNGCQSGHSREWKIDADYEKVYGLANAFLLCGVRHFLGTFWEIQDEPSLLFALEFYENLLNGAMIGEAVREARVRLVHDLGEENVIWASYMLYGDPTFQYINGPCKPAEIKQRTFSTLRKKEMVAGQLRSPGQDPILTRTVSFSWFFLSIAGLLGLIALLSAIFLHKVPQEKSQSPSSLQTLSSSLTGEDLQEKGRRTKRIDKLIDELAQKFRQGDLPQTAPQWNSSPISLVFFDVRANGISQAEKDFLLGAVSDSLQKNRRLQIVDRSLLEHLLEELKLSSSKLTDPAMALKMGKILSAKVMITGSILQEKKDWMINLRVIDTETTSVVTVISTLISTSDLKPVIRNMSEKINSQLAHAYPLQGKIVTVDGKRAIINLGSEIGLQDTAFFEILSESGLPIGSLKITEVQPRQSRALITAATSEIDPGCRIREIIKK